LDEDVSMPLSDPKNPPTHRSSRMPHGCCGGGSSTLCPWLSLLPTMLQLLLPAAHAAAGSRNINGRQATAKAESQVIIRSMLYRLWIKAIGLCDILCRRWPELSTKSLSTSAKILRS